jgi:hypothetical protein
MQAVIRRYPNWRGKVNVFFLPGINSAAISVAGKRIFMLTALQVSKIK